MHREQQSSCHDRQKNQKFTFLFKIGVFLAFFAIYLIL